MLVVLVMSTFAAFGYIIRQTVLDLRELQKFVRTELASVIDDNTVCLAKAAASFKRCPAFDSDVDVIADGNGTKIEDTPDLDATAKRAIQRRKERVVKKEATREGA